MVEDRGRAPSSSSVSKKGGSGSGGLGGGSGGQVPASYLEPGARLEARDPSNEQWFPVKVEDSDKEAKEVLIHYVQWNSRHDEWLAMDSPRLRVPLRTSGRHDSGGPGAGAGGSSVAGNGGGGPLGSGAGGLTGGNGPGSSKNGSEDGTGSKAKGQSGAGSSNAVGTKDFKSGEMVMATWKLNRKFPAKVMTRMGDGTFMVEFYDGVQCCVKANNIRRIRKEEEASVQKQIMSASANTPSPNGTGSSSNAADKIDDTSHPGGGKSNYDLETASDQGSGSRSQTPDSAAGSVAVGATPLSGRRERRKKFDVKSLFNMKSATPQTPSNSNTTTKSERAVRSAERAAPRSAERLNKSAEKQKPSTVEKSTKSTEKSAKAQQQPEKLSKGSTEKASKPAPADKTPKASEKGGKATEKSNAGSKRKASDEPSPASKNTPAPKNSRRSSDVSASHKKSDTRKSAQNSNSAKKPEKLKVGMTFSTPGSRKRQLRLANGDSSNVGSNRRRSNSAEQKQKQESPATRQGLRRGSAAAAAKAAAAAAANANKSEPEAVAATTPEQTTPSGIEARRRLSVETKYGSSESRPITSLPTPVKSSLQPVTGKRERKKKKFWDEEVEEKAVSTPQATPLKSAKSRQSPAAKNASSEPSTPSSATTHVNRSKAATNSSSTPNSRAMLTVSPTPSPEPSFPDSPPLSAASTAAAIDESKEQPVHESSPKSAPSSETVVKSQERQPQLQAEEKAEFSEEVIPVATPSESNEMGNVPNVAPAISQNSTTGVGQKHHPPVVTNQMQAAARGKTNGKILKYRLFDMTADPAAIAAKMIEGVNIPGPGVSIPVDSSKLPSGWEKRVIQRGIGVTKGKWDVFIVQEEGRKSFRSKTELQKYIDEHRLPYTSDAFDFSLDDLLKRLRQIWKQHIVGPRLSPGERMSLGVPAKKGRKAQGPGSESPNSNSASPLRKQPQKSPLLPLTPQSTPTATTEVSPSSLGFASETGRGLRCSIPKCGKLFRKDKLLRQHVKHYHPKVFLNWLRARKEALRASGVNADTLGGSDASDMEDNDSLSPPIKGFNVGKLPHQQLSNSSDPNSTSVMSTLQQQQSSRKRKLTTGSDSGVVLSGHPLNSRLSGQAAALGTPGGTDSPRKRLRTEPSSEDHPDFSVDEPPTMVCRTAGSAAAPRSRNDSLLSVAGLSDCSEATLADSVFAGTSATGAGSSSRGSCPPTPPTFRLSERRQAQLRDKQRKRGSLTASMLSKVSASLRSHQNIGEEHRFSSRYRDNSTSWSGGLGTVYEEAMSPGPQGSYVGSQSSYPPSEMDASVCESVAIGTGGKHEHLTTEEVVNCSCKRSEEDGLMIQCDICLCWQHGTCLGVEEEDQVQDYYVCDTCRHPRLGKTGAQLAVDQDWLNKGALPSVPAPPPVPPGAAAAEPTPTSSGSSSSAASVNPAFRKLTDLMSDLANLAKVLHSLRVKLHVASQSNSAKVFMWSSQWDVPTPSIYEEIAAASATAVAAAVSSANVTSAAEPPSNFEHPNSTAIAATSAALRAEGSVAGHFSSGGGPTNIDPQSSSADSSHTPTAEVPNGSSQDFSPTLPPSVNEEGKSEEPLLPGEKCSTPVPLPQDGPLINKSSTPTHQTTTDLPSKSDDLSTKVSESEKEFNGKKVESGVKSFAKSDADNVDRVSGGLTNGDLTASATDVEDEDMSPTPPAENSSNKENEEVNCEDAGCQDVKEKLTSSDGGCADSHVSLTPPPDVNKGGETSISDMKTSSTSDVKTTPRSDAKESDINTSASDIKVNGEVEKETHEGSGGGLDNTTPLDGSGLTNHCDETVPAGGPDGTEGGGGEGNDFVPLIPSLSEVRQLMSSLENQEQQQDEDVDQFGGGGGEEEGVDDEDVNEDVLQDALQTAASAPVPLPPRQVIIPEPKSLDKDECRLNLLEHIDAVQTEFENRLEVMEKTLAEVEQDRNGSGSSGRQPLGGVSATADGVIDPVAQTKVLLSLLLQDLATANLLVHSK